MQDRIDALERHVRLLRQENKDLIEEARILQNDKEALLRLVAELREELAGVRQVSNSPDLPTGDSGVST